jgi:hypothetical protein
LTSRCAVRPMLITDKISSKTFFMDVKVRLTNEATHQVFFKYCASEKESRVQHGRKGR